jgi:hypothetical protein
MLVELCSSVSDLCRDLVSVSSGSVCSSHQAEQFVADLIHSTQQTARHVQHTQQALAQALAITTSSSDVEQMLGEQHKVFQALEAAFVQTEVFVEDITKYVMERAAASKTTRNMLKNLDQSSEAVAAKFQDIEAIKYELEQKFAAHAAIQLTNQPASIGLAVQANAMKEKISKLDCDEVSRDLGETGSRFGEEDICLSEDEDIEQLLSSFKSPYFSGNEEKQSKSVEEDLDQTEDLTQQSQYRISKTLLETPLPSLENLGISKSALELIKPSIVPAKASNSSTSLLPDYQLDFIQENISSSASAYTPVLPPQTVHVCKIRNSDYERLPSYLQNMISNEEINQILNHAFSCSKAEGSNRWINSEWFNLNYASSNSIFNCLSLYILTIII